MDQTLDLVAFNGYLPLRIVTVLVIVCLFLRRRNRPALEMHPPLIGNMSNNIYHSNQCQYGRRVGEANRRGMLTHAEALHHGYRPCKECLGPYAADPCFDASAAQCCEIAATPVLVNEQRLFALPRAKSIHEYPDKGLSKKCLPPGR